MRVKECERYTCLRRCRLVVSASTFIASKLICFARLCVNLVQPFHQCTVSLCVLYLLQVENASDFDIRLPAALSRDPRGTTDSDEQRSRQWRPLELCSSCRDLLEEGNAGPQVACVGQNTVPPCSTPCADCNMLECGFIGCEGRLDYMHILLYNVYIYSGSDRSRWIQIDHDVS